MWANEDPIGKVWEFDGKKLTIVGVVKDSGANEFINPGSIEAYTPLSDERMQEAMLIVHTTGNPVGLVRMAQTATSLPGAPVFVSLMRGFPWEKTTKKAVASVYTNCETA